MVTEDNSVHYIKKDPDYLQYATFWGICKAKTVDAYWGAGGGTDHIFYIDNYNGTYNFYFINDNKWRQWWDRFIWNNGNDVIELHCLCTPDVTNNNRFNNSVIESYDFGEFPIKTKSLRETFYNCKKLKEVDISHWDLSVNTDCYASFAEGKDNGTVLEEISLPSVVCSTSCTQSNKMFGWCQNLITIKGMTSPNFNNVTNFSEMFCQLPPI